MKTLTVAILFSLTLLAVASQAVAQYTTTCRWSCGLYDCQLICR